jgi:CRP/FNR family transcriptional regulator, cyclic AMP receptor protein
MKFEGTPRFDPEAFLASTGVGKTRTVLRPRQTVFSQGDPADAVFYIQRGKIELKVLSAQGKEAILGILGVGDFFGEGCLFSQPLRMSTAVAVTEGSAMRLEKSVITSALRDQPAFSARFISHLLSRNIRLEENLVDQLFNSSEKRLARLLLLLANIGMNGKQEAMIPKISQETLAEMIGTTRSRVSFFMNKFRKVGFVEYDNGDLRVRSSLLNVLLHMQ